MLEMIRRLYRHPPAEKGQGLVEYALILVLVAVVVIVILSLLGPQIADIFGEVTCSLQYASDYSPDYQWMMVVDQASYDRFAAELNQVPVPLDPADTGCYGWDPANPAPVGPLK